jgi:hypothetical protein
MENEPAMMSADQPDDRYKDAIAQVGAVEPEELDREQGLRFMEALRKREMTPSDEDRVRSDFQSIVDGQLNLRTTVDALLRR